jgi:primosomal protein N'
VMMAQMSRNAIASETSAILIVPDFRDIARVVADLESDGLGDFVCRLDAEVEPAVRWVNYLRCVRGDSVIVVGSRSAAYAPVARLGAVCPSSRCRFAETPARGRNSRIPLSQPLSTRDTAD